MTPSKTSTWVSFTSLAPVIDSDVSVMFDVSVIFAPTECWLESTGRGSVAVNSSM